MEGGDRRDNLQPYRRTVNDSNIPQNLRCGISTNPLDNINNLQRQLQQVVDYNDYRNGPSQQQHEARLRSSSISYNAPGYGNQYSSYLSDHNDMIRTQQQLILNQEQMRLKERLLQEIWEKNQNESSGIWDTSSIPRMEENRREGFQDSWERRAEEGLERHIERKQLEDIVLAKLWQRRKAQEVDNQRRHELLLRDLWDKYKNEDVSIHPQEASFENLVGRLRTSELKNNDSVRFGNDQYPINNEQIFQQLVGSNDNLCRLYQPMFDSAASTRQTPATNMTKQTYDVASYGQSGQVQPHTQKNDNQKPKEGTTEKGAEKISCIHIDLTDSDDNGVERQEVEDVNLTSTDDVCVRVKTSNSVVTKARQNVIKQSSALLTNKNIHQNIESVGDSLLSYLLSAAETERTTGLDAPKPLTLADVIIGTFASNTPPERQLYLSEEQLAQILNSLKLNDENHYLSLLTTRDQLAKLPQLPLEPLVDDIIECTDEAAEISSSRISPTDSKLIQAELDNPTVSVTEPTFFKLPQLLRKNKKSSEYLDPWWPSENVTKRDRCLAINAGQNEDESKTDEMFSIGPKMYVSKTDHDRLTNDAEPGVLDKLPFCKLYDESYLLQTGVYPSEPLYCIQVTEMLCTHVMVCCSVCSTWRHAECGGHHTKYYSPKSCSQDCVYFVPVCDRCHAEQHLLEKYPLAQKRIDKQRVKHLQRIQMTCAVIRQAAFSELVDWPLGSVPEAQTSEYVKDVDLCYLKAANKWSEMIEMLEQNKRVRSRDKGEIPNKELKYLLEYLEDAEDENDRHNMILFLQRDTERRVPVGFERPRCSIFDPTGDDYSRLSGTPDVFSATTSTPRICRETVNNTSLFHGDDSLLDDTVNDGNDYNPVNSETAENPLSIKRDSDSMQTLSFDETTIEMKQSDYVTVGCIAQQPVKKKCKRVSNSYDRHCLCARPGCQSQCRFDSTFCSDACGVATMELDLLRSLSLAQHFIHPHLLRPTSCLGEATPVRPR